MLIDIYENVKNSNDYYQLSNNQKEVHQFILANSHNFSNITVEEIAAKCFCSTTTVNRYCHKMGAEGFSELKHALIEYATATATVNQQMVSKLLTTTEGIDYSQISEIVKCLREDNPVYIFGTGSSYLLAKYLQRLLIRVGINATAFNEMHYIKLIPNVKTIIIISNTGETHSAIAVANGFTQIANLIGITKADSRVARLCKYSITHNNDIKVNNSIDNEIGIAVYVAIATLIIELSKVS